MVDEKDLRRGFKDYLNDKVSNGKLSVIDANTQYSDADYPRKHAQELGLDYFEMFKTDKDFEQALDLIKLNFEKNGKKNTTFLAYKRALLSFRDFYLEYLKNHTKKLSVKAWFIRSKDGEYVQDFLEKQVVGIGWLRESYEGKSREAIKNCLLKECPNEKQGTIDQWAGCCWRFACEIKVNDYVITNNNDGTLHIGKIIGEYEYSPDFYKENPHIRSVKWIEKIERKTLPAKIQSYLKSSLTVTSFDDSEAIKCLEEICKQNSNKEQDMTKIPLNQILYGPPGTGKTYNTVIKAMEIINDKKYDSIDVELYKDLKKQFDNLKKQGQIEFVTFHQSYSYEEFVEGIKPYIPEWETVEENNRFIGQDGIFKKICNSAKTTIEGNFEKIYSQFIEEIDENYEFKTKKGSFKIRVNDNDGLTIRTGDNFEKETCGTITKEQIKNQTFTSLGRKQKLEAITKYLKEKYGLTFSTSIAVKPHILIIDEINRGDVSKIFGELITLIEEDKRICKEHQMTVTLPYSRETFGVPDNLYIIGTMNTADRSIALLDTALRRRFDFEEMMPKPEKIVDENKQPQMVEDINLQNLLKNINERISHILDRDHQIGHSYLMGVKNKEQLERAYKNRILPLLNEYFYNDIDSVAKILNCKPNDVSSKENWFNVLKEAQKSTKKDNEQ